MVFGFFFSLNFFFVFFKLYELDNDPKRKEFLDDLFTFMQKRGRSALKTFTL